MIRKDIIFEALCRYMEATHVKYIHCLNSILNREELILIETMPIIDKINLYHKCKEKGVDYIDLYILLK